MDYLIKQQLYIEPKMSVSRNVLVTKSAVVNHLDAPNSHRQHLLCSSWVLVIVFFKHNSVIQIALA